MLTQRAQENMNIFRKTGISVHKNYLKEKNKQLNLVCLTICLMISYYWKLLGILQLCNL